MQTLLPFLALAAAARAAQPSAPSAKAAPLRDLPWKQLNFLHTTDTHGWFGGHLQESSFSADWGDYISFAHHLHLRADDDGSDLLLIDTGDRIEGNGLYDGSKPKGKYLYDILKQQQIDVITSGNHELYKDKASYAEYYINVPNFEGNYVASNLDIYDNETSKYVPLAPRFKKFITKNQGIRIIAFGFLFDFDGNSNSTRVQRVEDSIKEQWFQDVIREEDVDLFLVTGHSGIRSEEYIVLFEAIRKQKWDTPIAFFGGHIHVRDFKEFDDKAAGLASGRYLETIGFMSVEGLNTAKSQTVAPKLSFDRLYIDNNLYSLHYHSQKNDSTFPTKIGQNVSSIITDARKEMSLDRTYGCAPKDLWTNRAKVDSEDSIFRWLGEQVLPDSLAENKKGSAPKLIITNTGALRFDIFKGPVTIDTTFLICPFTSGFKVLKDVRYDIAAKILDVLNSQNKVLDTMGKSFDPSALAPPEQARTRHSLTPSLGVESERLSQTVFKDRKHLTPGYTTEDDYGTDGDDTEHSYIQFYNVPNCIQSLVDFPTEPDEIVAGVDVVYNDFIEPWLFRALEFLGSTRFVNQTTPYLNDKALTSILSDWVQEHWPCEGTDDL